MKYTYSITQAQAKLPGVVREAQSAPVSITRHDKQVAYIISKERMDSITETLELLANPEALASIEKARTGTQTYIALDELDE